MGTTQSVEESDTGYDAAAYGGYMSHKRPRTLSRGSSADGERGSSRILSICRAKSNQQDADPKRKQETPACHEEEDPPPPFSTSVASHPKTDLPASKVVSPLKSKDKETTQQLNKSNYQNEPPYCEPGAEETGESSANMNTEVHQSDLSSPSASSILPPSYRSRQRPRNPSAKPPDAEELRRLMDKSRAMKVELQTEESAKMLAIVHSPHDNDVLLGRGRRTAEHPGSKRFRSEVRSRRDEYNRSWKYQKQELAAEIVNLVRSTDPPGRFLEALPDGTWKEVSKKQAIEKASQAMREKKWIEERDPKRPVIYNAYVSREFQCNESNVAHGDVPSGENAGTAQFMRVNHDGVAQEQVPEY